MPPRLAAARSLPPELVPRSAAAAAAPSVRPANPMGYGDSDDAMDADPPASTGFGPPDSGHIRHNHPVAFSGGAGGAASAASAATATAALTQRLEAAEADAERLRRELAERDATMASLRQRQADCDTELFDARASALMVRTFRAQV
jgi:hypothetical protein